MSYQNKEEVTDEPVTERSVEDKSLDIDPKLALEAGIGDDSYAIKPVKYITLRRGLMSVSYAVIDGDDYYYQIKVDGRPTCDVIASIAQAFLIVVPNHIQVYIKPPPEDIDWPVFTVVAKGSANLPGAAGFMEGKLVEKLLSMDLWS